MFKTELRLGKHIMIQIFHLAILTRVAMVAEQKHVCFVTLLENYYFYFALGSWRQDNGWNWHEGQNEESMEVGVDEKKEEKN